MYYIQMNLGQPPLLRTCSCPKKCHVHQMLHSSSILSQAFDAAFCWYNSTSNDNSIIMIFSATLFSKWRIQGIACSIKIIAASFPSSPLLTACAMRLIRSSVFKNFINHLLRSSKEPRTLSFLKCNSLVIKLLNFREEAVCSSSISPCWMR